VRMEEKVELKLEESTPTEEATDGISQKNTEDKPKPPLKGRQVAGE